MKERLKSILKIIIIITFVLALIIPLIIPIFFSSWQYNTEKFISDIAITPDGEFFVCGTNNVTIYSEGIETILEGDTLYYFEKSKREPLIELKAEGAIRIESVDITSDGNYIVAAAANNYMYLFEKSNSLPIWSYLTNGTIHNVKFSSDNNYIVAGGSDNKTYVFNRTSLTLLWNYTTGGIVYTIDISYDSNYIAVGGSDFNVYLFNITNPLPIWNYTTNGNVISVAISSDGKYIVAGSNDAKIYLFNKTNPVPLWNYSTFQAVNYVDISLSGNTIGAASDDGNIYIFEVLSPNPLWSYSADVQGLKVSNDGNYITAVGMIRGLYVFHRSDSEPYLNQELSVQGGALAISSDCSYIALGGEIDGNGVVYLIDKNNPTTFESYFFVMIISLISISSIGVISFVIYKVKKVRKVKSEARKVEARERLEKLKEFIEGKTQIEVETLRNFFNINDKTFDRSLYEWALEYNLTIDGDIIIINKDTVSEFIDKLDKQFRKWEKMGEVKKV